MMYEFWPWKSSCFSFFTAIPVMFDVTSFGALFASTDFGYITADILGYLSQKKKTADILGHCICHSLKIVLNS